MNQTLVRFIKVSTPLVLALFSPKLFALEHWYIPTEAEIKTIVVTNPTSNVQLLWMAKPIDENPDNAGETSFALAAGQKLEFPLLDSRGVNFIHVKAQSKLLTLSVIDQSGKSHTWPKGASASYKEFQFSSSSAVIINLTPFEQSISVNGDTHVVSGFAKFRTDLKAGTFQATSSARFLVAHIKPNIEMMSYDSTPVSLTAPPEGHFFLLTNSQKNQSYVVNITNPSMLSEARNQIQNPSSPNGRILVGEVGKNSGGFNRDFNDAKKTPWSWHVENAMKFAELASQDCDGSPEMLEELALPWIESSSVICFWNYKVIKELSSSDLTH